MVEAPTHENQLGAGGMLELPKVLFGTRKMEEIAFTTPPHSSRRRIGCAFPQNPGITRPRDQVIWQPCIMNVKKKGCKSKKPYKEIEEVAPAGQLHIQSDSSVATQPSVAVSSIGAVVGSSLPFRRFMGSDVSPWYNHFEWIIHETLMDSFQPLTASRPLAFAAIRWFSYTSRGPPYLVEHISSELKSRFRVNWQTDYYVLWKCILYIQNISWRSWNVYI